MEQELRALAEQEDPLTFSTAQIEWLLAHIGDPDGAIRDGLVYQLLGRGFFAGGFSVEQKQLIAAQATANAGLFAGIGEQRGDLVYTRTFTALLGQLMLAADTQQSFLTAEQVQTWLTWALRYLHEENDGRGFVPEHGWAHAIAHGSDLLSAAVAHPAMTFPQLQQALAVVVDVLQRQTAAFLDDDEERLAMVIVGVARNAHYPRAEVLQFLAATTAQLFAMDNGSDWRSYYRVSAWKRVLQTLYFVAPSLQASVQPLLVQYYQRNGFL